MIKIFFNWQSFVSMTITFIFNIILAPKIAYSYCFVMNFFFFMLKMVINISNYSVFDCFIFFSLKRFPISLIMFSSIFFIFSKPWTFHHYTLRTILIILFQKMFFKKKISDFEQYWDIINYVIHDKVEI